MRNALFKSPIDSSVKIDEVKGIIYGIKLALFNAVANASDGNGKGVIANDHFLNALLSLASGSPSAFLTHDWVTSDKDPINFDIGFWSAARRDGDGNLVADLHLCPGPNKRNILWRAKNDPKSISVSPNFLYKESDPLDKTTPMVLRSFDLVKFGAVTKGLFSAENNEHKNKMTPEEIQAAIAKGIDTGVAAALPYAVKLQIEAMLPALFAAHTETNSEAINKLVEAKFAAESPAMLMRAEAAMVAKIGTGPVPTKIDVEKPKTAEAQWNAKIEEYRQGGKVSEAVASMRLTRDNPELFEAYRSNLYKAPIKG